MKNRLLISAVGFWLLAFVARGQFIYDRSGAGGGGGTTTTNAADLTVGTLADARLSTNVALLNGTNLFTGSNSLSAASLTSGALADARLSTNVPLLNGTNLFTGSNSLSAASLTSGALADARLSTNVALLNGTNSFSGTNSFTASKLLITGVLPIANLATGTPDGAKYVRDDGTLVTPVATATNLGPLVFPTNAGIVTLIDLPVSTNVSGASAGTQMGYGLAMGGTNLISITGVSSGLDVGVTNLAANLLLNVTMLKQINAIGTTGNQTVNTMAGRFTVAASGQSVVITDSYVTANSVVMCTLMTDDTTAKSCIATPTAGSFTAKLNAAATAATQVHFLVMN